MPGQHWRYWVVDQHSMGSAGLGATTSLDVTVYTNSRGGLSPFVPAGMAFPVESTITQEEGSALPFYTRFYTAQPPQEWAAVWARNKAFAAAYVSTLGLGLIGPNIMEVPPPVDPLIAGKPYFAEGALVAAERRLDLTARLLQSLADAPGYKPYVIPASAYSYSVCQLMEEIKYHMLENPLQGFAHGLWTVAEVLQYTNQRIYRFLVETGALLTRTTIPVAAGSYVVDLPTNWIEIRRVAWTSAGVTKELPREDAFTLDAWKPTWESVGETTPSCYVEDPNPSLQVRLAPVPTVAGTVDLIGVAAPDAVTAVCLPLPLPDEWCVYVKWGVMADMLSKEGEANDPERAQICESRWKEGVSLCRLMLGTEETSA